MDYSCYVFTAYFIASSTMIGTALKIWLANIRYRRRIEDLAKIRIKQPFKDR